MFGKTKVRQIATVIIVMFAMSSFAFADNEKCACSDLGIPFYGLSQMVMSSDVPNLPQARLCRRLANVSKHNGENRPERALCELEKFIVEVERNVPKNLNDNQAQKLIAEANHVINILAGDYDAFAANTQGSSSIPHP